MAQVSLKPLDKQVIVITGASSGIGLATTMAAAHGGARLVIAARNAEALDEVASKIRAEGGQVVAVPTDVSKPEQVEHLADEAIKAFGGFDTWVNDAGLGLFGRVLDVADAESRQLFDINFWGLVYGSRVAARHLKTRGGAIINLGSVASDVAIPIQGMYSASKHAIKGFTDALRLELSEAGAPVSVTLIKPAAIDTPFAEHAYNAIDREPKLPPPIYRATDVADAILYAAQHGGRDYYIGGGGRLMSSLNKHLPAVMDWITGSSTFVKQQGSGEPRRPREGAMYGAGTDGRIEGETSSMVRSSLYTKATVHPLVTGALLAAAGLAAATLFSRRNPHA